MEPFILNKYIGETVTIQFHPNINDPRHNVDRLDIWLYGGKSYFTGKEAWAEARKDDKRPFQVSKFYCHATVNGENGILEYSNTIKRYLEEQVQKSINLFDIKSEYMLRFDVITKDVGGSKWLDYENMQLVKCQPLWDGTDDGKIVVKDFLSDFTQDLKGFGERYYKSSKLRRNRKDRLSTILEN